MKPSADLVNEAVSYIEKRESGARPELDVLVQRIERALRNSCTVVKLHMFPEIAAVMQEDIGGFDFALLSDIDEAMLDLGPTYSMSQFLEIVLLERYWSVSEPIRVAAAYDKYDYDLCCHAIRRDIKLDEMEVFSRHFTVTEKHLDELAALPLKAQQVAALLDDGLAFHQVISLTNDLRRDGLRGLADRVRAAAEGHPKPLLDGAI